VHKNQLRFMALHRQQEGCQKKKILEIKYKSLKLNQISI